MSTNLSLLDRLRLWPTMIRMTAWQFQHKRGADVRCHDGVEPPAQPAARENRWTRTLRRARNLLAFLRRMRQWNASTLGLICGRLREARANGIQEVVLYGEGHVATAVLQCAVASGIKVIAVCPWGLGESHVPASLPHWPEAMLPATRAGIVIATLVNASRHLDRLTILGVPRERTIVLE